MAVIERTPVFSCAPFCDCTTLTMCVTVNMDKAREPGISNSAPALCTYLFLGQVTRVTYVCICRFWSQQAMPTWSGL